MKHLKSLALASAMMLSTASASMAAPDPNFYIYLCIGQSNMEGNAAIEPQDRVNVPERFKMMATADFDNPVRKQGRWDKAVPPLVRQYTGLTLMDYFGRTMLDNLPENVTIGVVPVAIGGCKIEHLDKDYDPVTVVNEAEWFKGFMKAYDNTPYKRLIECAKEAQKDGVIKGILLHQGESNTGDPQWPAKVNKVYTDILNDLGLNAADVPLLAGEVVTTEEGGHCGAMNPIIDSLPQTIPNAHVISAANLAQKGDGLHFTAHSYRVLGCRYATKMLNLMGIKNPTINYNEAEPFIPEPKPSEGDYVFDFKLFNPNISENGSFDESTNTFTVGRYIFGGWQYDTPVDLSGYKYIVAELEENDSNGVEFKVFDTANYSDVPYSARFNRGKLIVAELKGMMKNLDSGITPLNTSSIYGVGFMGRGAAPIRIKHVFATNTDPFNTAKIK